jgi:hypothetical protein
VSYRVTVEIVCDHADCDALLKYQEINRGGLNKTWAGYTAAREGWWVRGQTGSTDPRIAYCPQHRAEHGK